MLNIELNPEIIITIIEIVSVFFISILYSLYRNAKTDLEYYKTICKHEQMTNKMLRKRIEELEKEEEEVIGDGYWNSPKKVKKTT
jgi:hypothetical protein